VEVTVIPMTFVNYDTLMKVASVLGGEEAEKIVEVLGQVDEITDEEIVDKTEIKLNNGS